MPKQAIYDPACMEAANQELQSNLSFHWEL